MLQNNTFLTLQNHKHDTNTQYLETQNYKHIQIHKYYKKIILASCALLHESLHLKKY